MLIGLVAGKTPSIFRQLGMAMVLALALGSVSQAHPLEQLEGFKRFNRDATLYSPLAPQQPLLSQLDIKAVKLGQNIVEQVIQLTEQGGELHTVTGGTRSEKATLSFFQPYQDSRLEQRLDLYFNKHSGFIQQINLRYFIASAYLSIEPVKNQVLQAAIAKYGAPLTMQDVRQRTKQNQGQVKVSQFVQSLQDTSGATQDYFKKLNISRNALVTKDQQDYALFHTGFDQCYFWPRDNYNEVLSFCSFAPNAANAASRGLEFSLVNFTIADVITELQHKANDTQQLSL